MSEDTYRKLKACALIVTILVGLTALGFSMPWTHISEAKAKDLIQEENRGVMYMFKKIDTRLERIEDCLIKKSCGFAR